MQTKQTLLAADKTVVERVGAHFVAATWRSVGVAIWRDETLAADVRFASEMLARLANSSQEGVGFVQYVEDSCSSLSSEARAALAELLTRGRPYIRCSTVVFSGVGFRAAAVRGIATGLFWLAKPGFPHEAFGDLSRAAFRQAGFFGDTKRQVANAKLLSAVVNEVRALRAVPDAV